jgi:hypothetical protein
MNYMIPSDDATIETVARAIARSRIHRDADQALVRMAGVSLNDNQRLEESFDRIFEILWNRDDPADHRERETYRADARAAISAINLKLVTSTP